MHNPQITVFSPSVGTYSSSSKSRAKFYGLSNGVKKSLDSESDSNL